MSHRRIANVVALVCAASFVTVPTGASAAASGAGRAASPDEPVAVGTRGAVASMDVGASRAGIDVLRRGGNAVDAAVATASALGVTVPFVAGPGGGGFMVIYNARTHSVTTIDGRETCPSACTTNLFIDPTTGQPMNYTAASDQPLSTGVPGNVATWASAVRKLRPALARRRPATGDRPRQARFRRQLRLQPARTVRPVNAAGVSGEPVAPAHAVWRPAAGRDVAARPGSCAHVRDDRAPRAVVVCTTDRSGKRSSRLTITPCSHPDRQSSPTRASWP